MVLVVLVAVVVTVPSMFIGRASSAEVVLPALVVFPAGTPCSFVDDWQSPRGTDASGNPLYHEGNDVIAALGTPIYAATAGTVTRLSQSVKGGNQLYLTMTDGTYLFHAHIDHYAAGIVVGSVVKAGDVIAYVGQTGDAQYTVAHLHFEVHPQGGAPVDPYPMLKAVDACGPGGAPTPPVPAGPSGPGYGGITTITPTRFADTRSNVGMTPFTTNTVNALSIAGYRGVPSDVTAVRATVTVTEPTTAGFLTVWPCGTGTPATSLVNFGAGETVANSTFVGLGGGRLCLRASTNAQVVVDVTAWQATGGQLGFSPVTTTRIADTRATKSRVAAGGVLTVAVPGAGARAATVNVTAVDPTSAGFLTVYPCGEARPVASTLNYHAHDAVASSATVGLGTAQSICVYSMVASDVLVDLNGIWTTGAGAKPSAVAPIRLVDTRATATRVAAGATVRTTVAGTSGLPGSLVAVAVNLTVTSTAGNGYLTAWPCTGVRPGASNLNFSAGETVANSATVSLDGGALCVYSSAATDLIVDVTGYAR